MCSANPIGWAHRIHILLQYSERGGSDDERNKRARLDNEESSAHTFAMDKQIIVQLAEVKKWRNAFQKYQLKVAAFLGPVRSNLI